LAQAILAQVRLENTTEYDLSTQFTRVDETFGVELSHSF